MKAKSTVTVFKLLPGSSRPKPFEEKWFVDREEALSFQSEVEGESCAQEAFDLNQNMLPGDVVRVETFPRNNKVLPQYFLCKSFGWEQFDGDTISLIRHLSW